VTCPICNQKIDPSDHSEKWGPEFAHSRCVIAFTAGSAIQNAKLQDRIKRLKCEVELLRLYGNKDCTAQADEVLKKEAKP
jgi:hypothetical protein